MEMAVGLSLYKRVREGDSSIPVQEGQGIPYLHSLFTRNVRNDFLFYLYLYIRGYRHRETR